MSLNQAGRSRFRAFAVLALGLSSGLVLGINWSRIIPPDRLTLARLKLTGKAPECSWSAIFRPPRTQFLPSEDFRRLRVLSVDSTLGLREFHTPLRPFWIRQSGRDMDDVELLASILYEQRVMLALAGPAGIRPGDVVIDVGAHIGTFGAEALRLGAARIVMIEPDPLNAECIRRSFRAEIAGGRVVLIPKGAWSRTDALRFTFGLSNSGTGSFVLPDAGSTALEVPVDRLDNLLREAGVSRVDFIKLDIEGAEREALRGALETLRRDHPRILLDAYHLPDDPHVLPGMIAGANPLYRKSCLACELRQTSGQTAAVPSAFLFSVPGR